MPSVSSFISKFYWLIDAFSRFFEIVHYSVHSFQAVFIGI